MIPALGRQKQEDLEFESSLGYTAKHHLKSTQKNKNKEKQMFFS
jgi:hypothetical protein